MEISESITVAATSKLGDDKCWYCEEQDPPDELNNETVADPQTNDSDDEDFPPENDVKNDASALGQNVGSRPEWQMNRPIDEKLTTVVPGAHHLIPGNASLKKAMDNGLKHFMCKGGNYDLESDIGYNVNDANNGVWLPGNYQVRPGNEDYTKKWSKYSSDFKNLYAVRAMKKANAQFHDAHSKYNKKVRNTLKSLKEKMILKKENECPICGKTNHKKTNPPFGLVSRLHFISMQHRQMLTGIGRKKSRKLSMIKNGYHTSSHVYALFGLKKS